jgi:hypothetical protein
MNYLRCIATKIRIRIWIFFKWMKGNGVQSGGCGRFKLSHYCSACAFVRRAVCSRNQKGNAHVTCHARHVTVRLECGSDGGFVSGQPPDGFCCEDAVGSVSHEPEEVSLQISREIGFVPYFARALSLSLFSVSCFVSGCLCRCLCMPLTLYLSLY